MICSALIFKSTLIFYRTSNPFTGQCFVLFVRNNPFRMHLTDVEGNVLPETIQHREEMPTWSAFSKPDSLDQMDVVWTIQTFKSFVWTIQTVPQDYSPDMAVRLVRLGSQLGSQIANGFPIG